MLKKTGFYKLFIGLYLGIAIPAQANQELSFRSGDEQAILIELFTSQGCSSCPPAERWLNVLIEDPRLWKTIVPVAFHVDYWDRLGWKDPFASEKNTQRQYQYRKAGDISSVYTPCFVVNGQEWRGWFSGQSLTTGQGLSGVLSAKLKAGQLEVTYSKEKEEWELHFALLGFNLETAVIRGENRNRKLKQEFVVLRHESAANLGSSWTVRLPRPPSHEVERYGLALWVTRPNDLTPLQATGGWLPKKTFED